VLTGRVVQRGDNLSISAELMDARDNSHIWGEQYNRKLTDLLALQQEIARDMSEKLRLKLSGEEQKRLTKSYTESNEAYQLYLKGRYYWNKQTEDGLKKAIEYFGQAIDKDPNYALAYTGLADSYWSMSDAYLPTKEAMPKAEAAAIKAVAIDDSLAEAYTSLAMVKYGYRWDWSGAEREFKRAIELNSNYPTAHHQYGWYLAYLGREAEALTEVKQAQRLDPLSLMINVDINAPFYLMRQYDQSIEQSRKVIEMEPNFFLAHYTVGLASARKGDFDQAIVELQKARTLEDKPWIVEALGYAYAASGRRGEAQKLVDELKEQAKRRQVPPYWIAMMYVGLGEKDEAFTWFERAYEGRSTSLLWFKTDPMLDPLRSDPRYADLLRRIGFPP
jgi:tetratricopeptide (TPR) repeat protein